MTMMTIAMLRTTLSRTSLSRTTLMRSTPTFIHAQRLCTMIPRVGIAPTMRSSLITSVKHATMTSTMTRRHVSSVPRLVPLAGSTRERALRSFVGTNPASEYRDVSIYQNKSQTVRVVLTLFPIFTTVFLAIWADIFVEFNRSTTPAAVFVALLAGLSSVLFYFTHIYLRTLVIDMTLLKGGKIVRVTTSNLFGTRVREIPVQDITTEKAIFHVKGRRDAQSVGTHVATVRAPDGTPKDKLTFDTDGNFDNAFDDLFYRPTRI